MHVHVHAPVARTEVLLSNRQISLVIWLPLKLEIPYPGMRVCPRLTHSLVNHQNPVNANVWALEEYIHMRVLPSSCKDIHIDVNMRLLIHTFVCMCFPSYVKKAIKLSQECCMYVRTYVHTWRSSRMLGADAIRLVCGAHGETQSHQSYGIHSMRQQEHACVGLRESSGGSWEGTCTYVWEKSVKWIDMYYVYLHVRHSFLNV